MISSEKPQNIILAITLIVGVLSAGSLVGTTGYYTGTIYLFESMDVGIQEIRITHLDLDNHTIDPTMRLVVNFNCPTDSDGKARLTTVAAEVTLNGDLFSQNSFLKYLTFEEGLLYPDFNKNFSLIQVITDTSQKLTIYNATVAEAWNFSIVLRFFYQTFNFESSYEEVRFMLFAWRTVNIV